MTPEPVEAAGAATVGPVVVLAHQPGRADSIVEADDVLAADQLNGAVLAAPAGLTGAVVVGDSV